MWFGNVTAKGWKVNPSWSPKGWEVNPSWSPNGWNVDLRSQNFSNLIKTMILEIQASGGAPEE